jgi:hypothetical protein
MRQFRLVSCSELLPGDLVIYENIGDLRECGLIIERMGHVGVRWIGENGVPRGTNVTIVFATKGFIIRL